ncbi:MAG: fatty acid desaturase, partial [bacterium]|nr:fatty acid desaturase [Candidatus Methylomirabilis sp.]
FPTALSVGLLSDVSAFAALTGAGLFVHEVIRSRRGEMEHVRRIEEEVVARRQAEEQLAFLIDSSPVAILTMTGDGSLLTLLLFPVGLRYHTLHHAFPLMPYHSMGEAHRRLMEQSAGDSVYRSTIVPSYWAAIRKLLRGARMAGQAGQNPMQVWRSSETTMSAQ